ncbi:hypothetical protein [Cryobacterium psychrophilum]|uniref:Uncharacterized protein n=1 Tax=Cryobacterium psychrophilum TaxID=41988 RepID=A0A4Y8KQN8_9MICO|nr:hypothetical protein [Cryobacterium psychrophilum]TDW29412.1 hypothetical protein EDD25_1107 [Cryobacterium psychrophilum]TFD81445.1 hypothetical protein E3T53_03005 [Cryobacterium psychrophilum]
MNGEALGGGVMVAVAAVLWMAYLMPTWSRRREYLATERNAVRLQQTLRILAETAEVPAQVRLEANARTVAEQQKILARTEGTARSAARAATKEQAKMQVAAADQAEADAAAAAHGVAAAIEAANRTPLPVSPARILRRLRRGRALSSIVLLTGLICALGGVAPIVATGSWLLFGMGVVTVAAAFLTLSRLAKVARTARIVHVAAPARAPLTGQPFEPVHLETTPVVAPTWTPQPLPRPLHLSRGSIAQTAMASVDAAAELRRVAQEAEIERRASRITASAAPLARPLPAPVSAPARVASAKPSTDSRFAAMGIVGETEPGMTDLDAVLRLRRAVG